MKLDVDHGPIIAEFKPSDRQTLFTAEAIEGLNRSAEDTAAASASVCTALALASSLPAIRHTRRLLLEAIDDIAFNDRQQQRLDIFDTERAPCAR